uniref:Single-stranded DNA-binding protein n=1 Tax=Panagrellus redivivus TaxID=6233 RepID=A0A7E4W4R4_PANRE
MSQFRGAVFEPIKKALEIGSARGYMELPSDFSCGRLTIGMTPILRLSDGEKTGNAQFVTVEMKQINEKAWTGKYDSRPLSIILLPPPGAPIDCTKRV